MSDQDFTPVTAKPCVKCGAAERYKSGDCKVCARAMAKDNHGRNKERSNAQSAAWYEANKTIAHARSAAWKKANPEWMKAYQQSDERRAAGAAYYKANLEKCRAASDAWHAANPLAARIHQNNSRARDLGREGRLSTGLASKLFALQQGMCPCCRQPLGNDFQMDHIVALHNDGPNTDDNIQLLRASCNANKKTKDPLDFMQSRGFLL